MKPSIYSTHTNPYEIGKPKLKKRNPQNPKPSYFASNKSSRQLKAPFSVQVYSSNLLLLANTCLIFGNEHFKRELPITKLAAEPKIWKSPSLISETFLLYQ